MYAVSDENGIMASDLQSIHTRLEEIRLYLEKEIVLKQVIIEEQKGQISQYKAAAVEKDQVIREMENQLQECRQTNEGTRQLINKLLQDISTNQKDLEWYKWTYEKRSLFGTIKQKLFKKPTLPS